MVIYLRKATLNLSNIMAVYLYKATPDMSYSNGYLPAQGHP